MYIVRGVARGGGAEPSRNLADQLTLFEPGWADLPLTLLPAPPSQIQKAIYTVCTTKTIISFALLSGPVYGTFQFHSM